MVVAVSADLRVALQCVDFIAAGTPCRGEGGEEVY